MTGFLYFIPNAGVAQLTAEQLADRGLGYAFDENPFCREARGETPSGTPGLVVGDRRRMGDHPVKLAEGQRWEYLEELELYVGWYEEDPPRPADLVRPQTLAGYPATMADGQEWVVPLTRSVDEAGGMTCQLPSRKRLEGRRLVPGEVLDRYRELWELTEPYWQAMIAEAEIDDQQCLEDAGHVLAANYYIGWAELALLGCYSTDLGPAGVMALAVGYPTWIRWQESKKNNLSPPSSTTPGSSTPDGEPD